MVQKQIASSEKTNKDNGIHQDDPELRFPEFNDEWETIKLSNFLEFIPTNSLSRAKLNLDEGVIKNIHYGDIHTKFPTIVDVNIEEIPYINLDEDTSKFKKEQFCKEGDLIIADASEDYADIGKAIELVNVNTKLVAGLHTILARDKLNKTVSGFKGYLFLNENLRKQIKIQANGISVLGISKNNIAKLDVNLPSLQEQEKIVSFLRAVDKKIELLEKTLENKKIWHDEIFNEYFSFDLKNKIQDQPKNYEKLKLNDLIKISNKRNKENKKLQVLSINNKIGFISQEEQFEDREIASSDKTNYKIVEKGDFAYNPARINVGSITRLKNYEEGIISPMYIIFKADETRINSLFLETYINTNYFNWEVIKRLEGSVRLTLSADSLKNIEIILPPLDEQEIMSNFSFIIKKSIFSTERQLIEMRKFKKSLLQKMFC